MFTGTFSDTNEKGNDISGGGFSNVFPQPGYQREAVAGYLHSGINYTTCIINVQQSGIGWLIGVEWEGGYPALIAQESDHDPFNVVPKPPVGERVQYRVAHAVHENEHEHDDVDLLRHPVCGLDRLQNDVGGVGQPAGQEETGHGADHDEALAPGPLFLRGDAAQAAVGEDGDQQRQPHEQGDQDGHDVLGLLVLPLVVVNGGQADARVPVESTGTDHMTNYPISDILQHATHYVDTL